MKTLLFITLKLVEIYVIIFVPYWIGSLTGKVFNIFDSLSDSDPKYITWLVGLWVIILISLIILVLYGLIILNLALVNQIL